MKTALQVLGIQRQLSRQPKQAEIIRALRQRLNPSATRAELTARHWRPATPAGRRRGRIRRCRSRVHGISGSPPDQKRTKKRLAESPPSAEPSPPLAQALPPPEPRTVPRISQGLCPRRRPERRG